MTKPISHVSRVDQLDAFALDDELLSILKANLTRAFEELHPRWLYNLEPELTALLKLLIWNFTVLKNGSTLGQRLLLLEFKDYEGKRVSKNQSWCLAGLQIGTQWLSDRIQLGLLNRLSSRSNEKALHIWKWIQTFASFTYFINYLIFLRFGHYTSPLERLVGMTSGNAGPKSIRQVQYEYMNRELLWHGLADFLTFIIPLINVRRLRNRLGAILFPSAHVRSSPLDRVPADLTECAYCKESPILPHDIGCKHVFCHYCIQSNVLSDANFQCPRCDNRAEGVSSIRPVTAILNPDY